MKNLIKIIVVLCIIVSCADNSSRFPVEKPVWDIEDYEAVSTEIMFGTPDDEKLPGFEEDTEVFIKLTDKDKVSKVLDDTSLGLQYRQEYSEKLFKVWKSLIDAYSITDRQDNFIYPMELVQIRDFGYFVQIRYFKLGNEVILKDAVNPDDYNVQSVLSSNEQAIIGNFTSAISFLTEENALTQEALDQYSQVLKNNLTELVNNFPDGDYSDMTSTIDNILKKVKTESIKSSLTEIKKTIADIPKPTPVI